MLKYLIAALLFVGAWGQNATQCASAEENREAHLSCLLYNDLAAADNETLSVEHFLAWFVDTCPEDGCSVDDFTNYVDGWPLCSTEVELTFSWLAGLMNDTSSPEEAFIQLGGSNETSELLELERTFRRLSESKETTRDSALIQMEDVIPWYITVLAFGDPIDQYVFEQWFATFYADISDPDYPRC